MNWYAFNPACTLLFKGAEPMVMGADHHASHIFPPPAQTIVGALRTTILRQNGVSFKDYYRKKVSPDILAVVGEAGEPSPFQITGPLFRISGKVYTPAPYSWFAVKTEKKQTAATVFRSLPAKSHLIKCEDETMHWVLGGMEEMESLGGRWIGLEDLFSGKKEMAIFGADTFFDTEPRTGIALNRNRSVKTGHLYTFTHVRLKPDAVLIFGTESPLPISDEGFLKLGAEQRFGRYEKIKEPAFHEKQTGNYLSLSQVRGTTEANQAVIATGKIQYVGGWDLKKGFHKPMQGFFPAGSVFSKKINSNFVQI